MMVILQMIKYFLDWNHFLARHMGALNVYAHVSYSLNKKMKPSNKKGYTLYFITSSAVLHLLGGSGISVMHVGHLTRITFVGPGFGILSKQSLQMRCPSLH